MNIVALSNRLASKVPHWHELEKLSKEDKIEVIALLSMSIADAEEIKTPADRTKEMVERYPEEMVEKAVKGMLPHNRLGRAMYKKLFVYRGENHPHMAQKPEEMDI